MEMRIPVIEESRKTPLPERVGTIIVDEEDREVYLLAVNPADQNTPCLMNLDGEKYLNIIRADSEPCEPVCYGDVETTLGTANFTLYTTEAYMLDLVAKKRQKHKHS